MGCGSSSTAVQTFKNPEENRNYQSQKVPSRQPSATVSIKSQRSKKSSRKSSASSRSSVSSSGSRRQKKREEVSRTNSASTRKTYTVQRPNSEVVNDSTLVTPIESHVDNVSKNENDVVHIEPANEIDENKLQAQRHHEEIQKQTFLTGDPDHEVDTETVTENNTKNRAEYHEEIAKQKEEKRSRLLYEEIEEENIKSCDPVPLSFPPDMDEAEEIYAKYTVDDIVEHNNEVACLDWFKYGKKIYSWKKMEPIIKGRIDQFRDPDAWSYETYPIYIAKQHKVSRKELAKVLSFCHIGYSVEVPEEQKLSRMKQSIENVLEEETSDSNYIKDYINQLNRWLANYPHCKIANDPPDATMDPNDVTFPLPADIQTDPTIMRKWIESWTEFDCDVPEEGAWVMAETTTENLGDTHEMFANEVKECHGIETLDPLDMSIDGDAAWFVIELDLFKNDQTTDKQENVWKKRATRTNLNDPVWMKRRREELGNILKHRYEKMKKDYPIEKYINFAEILEKHWEEFQTLCSKEFNPPIRNVRKTAEIKTEVKIDFNTDEEQDISNIDNTDNVLMLSHEDESKIIEDGDENQLREITNNNVRSQSRESSEGTCKRETPENISRAGSGRSNSNIKESPDKTIRASSRESDPKISERISPENILRLQSREGSSIKEEGNNNVNEDDQMPTLETQDSGLDLTSNDQVDVGKANSDNEKKDDDTLQVSEKINTNADTNVDDRKSLDDFY